MNSDNSGYVTIRILQLYVFKITPAQKSKVNVQISNFSWQRERQKNKKNARWMGLVGRSNRVLVYATFLCIFDEIFLT